MPLKLGDKLGPYEILSSIGEGGMGEVYKARDTRLDRSVAIKTSKSEFTERFEREARSVAALNHPNICQLYDVGSNYLVMELIDGTPLKGPLPLDKAIEAASQILDALDAAHRKGITHRDLKPANILSTKQGIKLLDFGLAKQMQTDETLTAEGQIVGTLQYMAPEQMQGLPADARTDIFAFGCILYELISGKRAFQQSSLTTGTSLDRIIQKCVAKDPDDRFQNARDLKYNLTLSPEPEQPVARASTWWPLAALILLALGAWQLWPVKRAVGSTPAKLYVIPPEGARFSSVFNAGGSAISPDGRMIAFIANNSKNEPLMYLRPIDELEARPLPGTEDAGRPFWSANGKSIGFVAGSKLKRVDISGGVPIDLTEVTRARGGTWNADGVILYGDQNSPLRRINASGGTSSVLTKLNVSGESHYFPSFLPGGKEFLYLVRVRENPAGKPGIYMSSLDGGEPTLLVVSSFKAVFDSTNSRLLYVRGERTLVSQKLELDKRRLTGEPVIIASDLEVSIPNGFASVSASNTGSILYGKTTREYRQVFAWRDRTGKLLEKLGPGPEDPNEVYLSPDGKRIVYSGGPAPRSIWVKDVAGGATTRISFDLSERPRWSADSRRIYYTKAGVLYRKSADGSGQEEALQKLPAGPTFHSLASDEKHIVVRSPKGLFSIAIGGGGGPVPILEGNYTVEYAMLSPNARWLAYQSMQSARLQILVQGYPDARGKWAPSPNDGHVPQWRADGNELFWLDPAENLMAAKVDTSAATLQFGVPQLLFRTSNTSYSPAPDGKRILVLEGEAGPEVGQPLVLVIN